MRNSLSCADIAVDQRNAICVAAGIGEVLDRVMINREEGTGRTKLR